MAVDVEKGRMDEMLLIVDGHVVDGHVVDDLVHEQ